MLVVESVGLEDGGTYVCTAETDSNTVHKTVQVTNSVELRIPSIQASRPGLRVPGLKVPRIRDSQNCPTVMIFLDKHPNFTSTYCV